jgi:myo-inositol-1(or 4)-monophosphatase
VTPESDLLDVALEAAEAAAAVHLKYHGSVRTEDAVEKGRVDFVSHVDLEAQDAALGVIRKRFPGHRILSEEGGGGESAHSTGPPAARDAGVPLWVVDPLDGTTNFLHSHPQYAASVGVTMDGMPVAGAVVAAATSERWWAVRGSGAFRNGERIHVSSVRELRGALIGTGFPFKKIEQLPDFLREMSVVLPACSGVRRGGSASLDLVYLAQGSLDAFWEITLDPWDVAAGLVILAEAGGVAIRRSGEAMDAVRPGSVVAANSPELLASLRELLLSA